MTKITKEAVDRIHQLIQPHRYQPAHQCQEIHDMLRALFARVEAVTSDRQYIVGHCEGYELGIHHALSAYRQRRMNVGANASLDTDWKIAHDELLAAENAIQALKTPSQDGEQK